MAQKNLLVKGAREHNLKNVDIEIPREKLVVLRDFPAPENHRWPSIRSMRRASGAMWRAYPPMRASS